MSKPVIVLKVKPDRFEYVWVLAQTVYVSMNGNPNFVNPQPSLPALKTAADQMRDAITAWGTVGNRGAHRDYVDLVDKSLYLHRLLTQLGSWCMTTVDPNLSDLEQEAILASSGFPLKSARKPQGMLSMVQNFRRIVSFNLELEKVKLMWLKPQGVAVNTNVKSYVVYRNTVLDFFTASIIITVSKTAYSPVRVFGITGWLRLITKALE